MRPQFRNDLSPGPRTELHASLSPAHFLIHTSVYLLFSSPPPALSLHLLPSPALWPLSANGTGSSSQLSTPISKHSPTSTPNSPGLNNKQKVPDCSPSPYCLQKQTPLAPDCDLTHDVFNTRVLSGSLPALISG